MMSDLVDDQGLGQAKPQTYIDLYNMCFAGVRDCQDPRTESVKNANQKMQKYTNHLNQPELKKAFDL